MKALLKLWPFVLRSTYECLAKDYDDLLETKMAVTNDNGRLIREADALRNLLTTASKNDHRDPMTGQFIKAPEKK